MEKYPVQLLMWGGGGRKFAQPLEPKWQGYGELLTANNDYDYDTTAMVDRQCSGKWSVAQLRR